MSRTSATDPVGLIPQDRHQDDWTLKISPNRDIFSPSSIFPLCVIRCHALLFLYSTMLLPYSIDSTVFYRDDHSPPLRRVCIHISQSLSPTTNSLECVQIHYAQVSRDFGISPTVAVIFLTCNIRIAYLRQKPRFFLALRKVCDDRRVVLDTTRRKHAVIVVVWSTRMNFIVRAPKVKQPSYVPRDNVTGNLSH